MNKHRELYKPNFFFNTIQYFEDLIFNSINQTTKAERLAYFLRLKDKCQKEIDNVFMKNRRNKIFKLVDDIEYYSNRETGEIEK